VDVIKKLYLGSQMIGFTHKYAKHLFQNNLQGDIINAYMMHGEIVKSH
jgi:hypothetical protein